MRLVAGLLSLSVLAVLAGCKERTAEPRNAPAPEAAARLEPSPRPPAVWVRRLSTVEPDITGRVTSGPRVVGGDVMVASPLVGAVAVDASGTAERRTAVREADPLLRAANAVGRGRVRGAARAGELLVIAWDDGVGATRNGELVWMHRFPEPVALSVAGPVVAGDWIVWVRDEELEAVRRDGTDHRAAVGQYASCRRCIATGRADLHASVRVIKRDAKVTGERVWMAPAAWVPATNSASFGAPMLPSGQVLDALFGQVGRDRFPLILAVRADSSLRNDWIHLLRFRGLGKPTGSAIAWKLPEPNGRRTEPVRLGSHGDALYVFFDGRYLARLDLAAKL